MTHCRSPFCHCRQPGQVASHQARACGGIRASYQTSGLPYRCAEIASAHWTIKLPFGLIHSASPPFPAAVADAAGGAETDGVVVAAGPVVVARVGVGVPTQMGTP